MRYIADDMNYYNTPSYSINLLNSDMKNKFETEIISEECDVFSAPVNTTNTIEGVISNVRFLEEELIKLVTPDEYVLMYDCNYGKKKYEHYTEPIKIKKTNRGRKKKPKKKNRKKQGNGTTFNSQMTFHMKNIDNVDANNMTPTCKIKLFRTGKVQIPGVKQHQLDSVLQHMNKICDVMNNITHKDETNELMLCKTISLAPVMRNYKFVIKLPENHIVDRIILFNILTREMEYEKNQYVVSRYRNTPPRLDYLPPKHPRIHSTKFTRQENALAVKFHTPLAKDPKKPTRVNIFMRGKINILGGYHTESDRMIVNYLKWIVCTYREHIIVRNGDQIYKNVDWPTYSYWYTNIYNLLDSLPVN